MSTRDQARERPLRRPARTPDARENQVIAKAVDLAEKQIEDGSASAQVISHYLKLGSSRELLEQERLRGENKLQLAKIQQIDSHAKMETLYADAMRAFSTYSGQEPIDDGYDD